MARAARFASQNGEATIDLLAHKRHWCVVLSTPRGQDMPNGE